MRNESDIFDDIYGSKYFSAADLRGEVIKRTIGKVDPVELKEKDGSTKKKFMVYFEGVEKPLVLNQTNARKLAASHGKDRFKWVGVTVEVYAEMTTLGKEGVRLRPLKSAAAGAAATDMNDSIQF